jgi:hypothetical protein
MTEAAETFTSDASGLHEAARALVESGKALPTSEITTSNATLGAVIKTYDEGRIASDGTDQGVGVRAAAKALAEERKAANELLGEMQAPAEAFAARAQEMADQIKADPDAALAQAQATADEVQALTQRAEAAEQALASASVASISVQTAAAYQGQGYLAAVHAGLLQQFQIQFPEFVGKDAGVVMAELQQTDTLRAKHAQATWAMLNTLYTVEEQKVAARVQQAQIAYEAWAKTEDLKFAELIGGPPDQQLARDAIDLLTNVLGIPQEELKQLWTTPLGFPLRDARAQVILAMAAKFARAQASFQVEQQKPAKPPVTQRPGVATSRADRLELETRELRKKAMESGSVRDWARVRGEQLRQRRG